MKKEALEKTKTTKKDTTKPKKVVKKATVETKKVVKKETTKPKKTVKTEKKDKVVNKVKKTVVKKVKKDVVKKVKKVAPIENKVDEKVDFDLSLLSLEELVNVYENINDFIAHLEGSKIIMEDKVSDKNE